MGEKSTLAEAIKEKVKKSEEKQKSGNCESQKLKKIDKLIKEENIQELQNFDFRNEILEVIFADGIEKKLK